MPEICRFFGIVIKMYWDDHNPPHFHAFYADKQALVDIKTLSIFAGELSPRATGLVIEWASIHKQELLDVWCQAQNKRSLTKIDPLP